MCMTIIGKVLEAHGGKGIVEVGGVKREMNLSLVDAKAGDFVSCSLGLAIEKIGAEEAASILGARGAVLEAKRQAPVP